jgi:hypothetical protein
MGHCNAERGKRLSDEFKSYTNLDVQYNKG